MKPFDEVGIFWDYECCPGPQEASGCAIANAITDLTRPFGRLRLFKAYIDTGDRALLRSDLQVSGVTPVECSRDNMVERLRSILVDLFTFALDNPAPCTIVVISSDPHLAHALSILKVRQYEVVLIAPPDAHGNLAAQASVRFDWAERVVGPSSRSDVATPDLRTPAPSTSLCAPVEPVRHGNEVEMILQVVEEKMHEPEYGSLGPPPVEVASTSRWRVQVAEEVAETIVPVDLGRGDNIWSTDTTTEETPTGSSSGDWFGEKLEEAPWARAPSPWMTSPPLQSTHAQAVWGHDFLADSEADVAGSALKNYATEETDDAQESVSTDSVLVLPEPPTEERQEDEGPPSTYEHASQGSPANVETTRAPRGEVPAQFLKLVQVLQTYKNQGNIRPSRSDVAVELGYGVYQLAGVGKFGQYARLAEEAGIVHLGSRKSRPWIGLKPAWYNAVPTIPSEFVKLVEVMQNFREQGTAEVYPSRVAQELGPLIYEEAGVQKFGQYVDLAIEQEILRRAMRRGKEWLVLESKWRHAARPS